MKQFFAGIYTRLSEEFNPETLGETFAVLLSNLIVGVLTFLAFYLLWFLLNRLATVILKNTNLDETAQVIVRRFELREKIFTSLTETGVNMPYETIELAPVEVKARMLKETA